MIDGFILFPAGEPRGTLAMMVQAKCSGLPELTHISPVTAPHSPIWFMVIRYSDTSMTGTVMDGTTALASKYYPNEQLFFENFKPMVFKFLERTAPEYAASYEAVFRTFQEKKNED